MEIKHFWSEDLKDVLDESFKPILAFTQILENVDGNISVPDEGHPVLVAKVMDVLLFHQKRVLDEAFKVIDREVGKINIARYTYAEENVKAGVAGQVCNAQLIGKERPRP